MSISYLVNAFSNGLGGNIFFGVDKDGNPEGLDDIQKAIVNALVHRLYIVPGTEVHVNMFDDRLEIQSPGGMVSGKRIQDLDLWSIPSERRNPILADLFQRMKLMERRGSGSKKRK